MNSKKLIIQSSDAAAILACSPRQARKILRTIREHFRKLPWQPVTIAEFSTYMGLDSEEVKDNI